MMRFVSEYPVLSIKINRKQHLNIKLKKKTGVKYLIQSPKLVKGKG